MNRRMELLDKPYIKQYEIAYVLDCSKSTVCKHIKEMNLKKYPWGYSTEEVIKKFGLRDYVKKQKKS